MRKNLQVRFNDSKIKDKKILNILANIKDRQVSDYVKEAILTYTEEHPEAYAIVKNLSKEEEAEQVLMEMSANLDIHE